MCPPLQPGLSVSPEPLSKLAVHGQAPDPKTLTPARNYTSSEIKPHFQSIAV
uniref:Uncharacterized protein n=1 Tax=Arundo donax TaxID=35708 RepID=A0A0A9C5T0_ARUDO